MDFTWEDTLTQRVMPPPHADPKMPAKQRGAREPAVRDKLVKRKQPDTDAGGMEPDLKRQRGVKEDPLPLHKLGFLVSDGKSSSFLATGFEQVSQITRADTHTFMWNTEWGIFCRIPSNCTPVLASERDHGIYVEELQRFQLYDSQ